MTLFRLKKSKKKTKERREQISNLTVFPRKKTHTSHNYEWQRQNAEKESKTRKKKRIKMPRKKSSV